MSISSLPQLSNVMLLLPVEKVLMFFFDRCCCCYQYINQSNCCHREYVIFVLPWKLQTHVVRWGHSECSSRKRVDPISLLRCPCRKRGQFCQYLITRRDISAGTGISTFGCRQRPNLYRHLYGHWSQEIKGILPHPLWRIMTTRSSNRLRPFQI